MNRPPQITVWNENVHESTNDPAGMGEYYPDGIHGALAAAIGTHQPEATVRTALLGEPEHGLGPVL